MRATGIRWVLRTPPPFQCWCFTFKKVDQNHFLSLRYLFSLFVNERIISSTCCRLHAKLNEEMEFGGIV